MGKSVGLFWVLLLSCMLGLSSCTGDEALETEDVAIPEEVLRSFSEMYPGVTDVSWSVKSDYAVAEFSSNGTKSTDDVCMNAAWFVLCGGSWGMTCSEIPYNKVPKAVREAFESTEYSVKPWKTENKVEVLQRCGRITMYIISVWMKEKKKEHEAELYFTEHGELIDIIIDGEDDDHSGLLPVDPTEQALQWIESHYWPVDIIDVDIEEFAIRVQFFSCGKTYTAVFTPDSEWLYTRRTLRDGDICSIEQKVMETLKASRYYVDEESIMFAYRFESLKAGVFYEFILDAYFDGDVILYISADGTLLDGCPQLGDYGMTAEGSINDYVDNTCPDDIVPE